MNAPVRLRDIGSTYGGLNGKTKNDFGRGSASFVTFLEVINNTRLRGRHLARVRVAKGERQNRVMRGDLLFNGSSETPEEVALSAVVAFEPSASTYLNSFCFGFRLRSDARIDPTFLAFFFRSSTGRSLVASLAQGATRYNIAKTKFLDVELDLPSVERQREIVEALCDADDLIAALERMVVKRQAIRQGMVQQLLSGKTRLPGFQGEWRVACLGEIADVKTGPFGSALHESDYVASGTPIATVEHLGEFGLSHESLPMVSDADRRRLAAYSLRAGDIVFSRVGSIDRNALVRSSEAGWLFSGRLLRVRVRRDQAVPAFLSYQFHGEAFKRKVREVAVGQIMPSLNTHILRGLQVILPPVAEQAAIAAALSDMDAELIALNRRLVKARNIKQGVVHELLTTK